MVTPKFFLTILLVLFLISFASAGTYYISKNGDNSDGSSWAKAWNELNQVNWGAVTDGSTIYVDGGDEGGNKSMYYTTSLNPTSDDVASITISPGIDAGHLGVVYINRSQIKIQANYITIDGKNKSRFIMLTGNTGGYGNMQVGGGGYDADHARIINVTFQGTNWSSNEYNGISANLYSENITIKDCEFILSAGEDMVGIISSGNITIEESIFRNLEQGITPIHRDVISIYPGTELGSQITIRYNYFYNATTDTIINIAEEDAMHGGMRIYGNVFVKLNNAIKTWDSLGNLSNNDVFNNVFHDTLSCTDCWRYNHNFTNNIISGNASLPVEMTTGVTYNIFTNYSGYSANGAQQYREGTGNINLPPSSPLFINHTLHPFGVDMIPFTSDDGFNVVEGSPSINNGTNFLTYTRDIINLPMNGTRDIGAFEYQDLGGEGGTPDTNVPSVTLNYPSNNSYFNSALNLIFNFTATDDTILGNCTLYGNFDGTWKGNYTWNLPESGKMNWTRINGTTEGIHLWNVYCNDTSNNRASASSNLTFTVDTRNPDINFGTGTNIAGANVSLSNVYINVSANDTNVQNVTFSLYNGTALVSQVSYSSLTLEHNFTSLAQGNYTYQVNITDKANNKNATLVRKILLDTSLSAATLLLPTDNSYNTSLSINFTATVTDNLGIKNVTLYVFNESGIENSTTITYPINTLSTNFGILAPVTNGIKKWRVSVYDWAGNHYYPENKTVTVDTINPNSTQSGFSPDIVYTETDVTFYGNISDVNLNSIMLQINYSTTYVNISVTTHTGHQYYYTLSNAQIDNFEAITWMWIANDSAGNRNTSLGSSFNVTNRNPYNVVISAPANASGITSSSQEFTFSATEPDGDTLNYTLYNSTDGTTFSIFNSTNSLSSLVFSNYTFNVGDIHYFYVTANDTLLENQSAVFTYTLTSASSPPGGGGGGGSSLTTCYEPIKCEESQVYGDCPVNYYTSESNCLQNLGSQNQTKFFSVFQMSPVEIREWATSHSKWILLGIIGLIIAFLILRMSKKV